MTAHTQNNAMTELAKQDRIHPLLAMLIAHIMLCVAGFYLYEVSVSIIAPLQAHGVERKSWVIALLCLPGFTLFIGALSILISNPISRR